MLPTFGTFWLLPRLRGFQEAHPEISLNVISSDGELDFVKERIDVAVRFGHGSWPDAICDALMGEEIQVVCSPHLMKGEHPLTSHEALRFHRLLRHSTRPHGWDHWFRSVGVHYSKLQWGPNLEHFFMIIQAAIAGLGVALVPTYLVEDHLRSGTLVAPFADRVAGPGAYYLVTPAAKASLPRVRMFRDWVLAQIGD